MGIIDEVRAPYYERDGIISRLLIAEMTTGAKHLTASLVKMRTGGASNFRSLRILIRANVESYRAWKINNLPVHWWNVLAKPFSKLTQLIK